MFYYISIFVIYALFGFLMENALRLTILPSIRINPLMGPWIPLYGFGAVIGIFLMRLVFNRFKLNRPLKIVSFFLLSSIILTILELISGILAKMVTGKKMWDYTEMKFNIGPYISLEMALLWGIISLLAIYIINPKLNILIKKIPKIIIYIPFVLILIDMFCLTVGVYK